jgi:HSP20 family protein
MNQIVEKQTAQPVRPQTANFIVPAVNIHQDGDGYTLEAEMPGVPKSGVEITFEDGKLTLTGHRTGTESTEGVLYRESPEADYRRAFDLDPTIDANRIEASIEQGLLRVRLPRAESAKPRRISVS